ncbi:uroporphyrinogen-III C-methyltransferase [Tolumonas auensis]|uniref:uroporphyrinogen-III C-methyltransferase n=1 Tax=Tolumonas auensis TaxID=43948 RepID=UPI002AA871CF|nr:uroporphyrinogen-III C-methyltransferase [Tolumonas auensis]
MNGFVSLVGAGPGDPDLLTVKALRSIQQADVVVYDRLVSDEILALIPASTARYDVGKRCGQPSLKQEAISELLVTLAGKYKRIVRLKGGDPYVFGRGGEEALLLVANGVPFEVVPGITAAIGCAAATGIPLTHRGLSRSVTLVTGHVQDGGEFHGWSGLVKAGGTLVFYMGLERATELRRGLLQAGAPANLPIALVAAGTTRQQRVEVTTLACLEQTAHTLSGLTPVLMIMGEVVQLRAELGDMAETLLQSVA